MSRGRILSLAISVGLLLIFVGLQLVPVDRSNPPVTGEIDAPDEVMAVLRRSCYDCHSNETEWPWYSYIAPISWLVVEDVIEGREEMNFSTWRALDADDRADLREEVWEEVVEGEMPLPLYLRMHSSARLSEDDRKVLHSWSRGGDTLSIQPDDEGDDDDDGGQRRRRRGRDRP